jgi:L-amino acid N-acyltransferase YncA
VRDNGLPWLVALWRGTIVGYCYATFYRPRPAYRYTLEESITWNPEWAGAASAARCCRG